METVTDPPDPAMAVLASLGDRLRIQRERRGLTLDQLAQLTDLSKPYLSRLENGDRQPAIGTLLVLARSLGITAGSLLGEDDTAAPLSVHRPAPQEPGPTGISIVSCSGYAGARDLEALKVVISRDRAPAPFARHAGEEWLYVVRGPLLLEYGPDNHTLPTGATAHFDAARPHRLNAVRNEAEVLLVATAPHQDLHKSHR
jgi:transcriptional regulator with XRE-family HTH domain